MKVEFLKETSSVLLTNNDGQSMKVSVMEFWEICRFGRELDIKGEVEEYLTQLDEINGVKVSEIESDKDLFDKIVDKVLIFVLVEKMGTRYMTRYVNVFRLNLLKLLNLNMPVGKNIVFLKKSVITLLIKWLPIFPESVLMKVVGILG